MSRAAIDNIAGAPSVWRHLCAGAKRCPSVSRRSTMPFQAAFGALHEVAGGGNGAVQGAAAVLVAAGIAARTRGKVLCCLTRVDLFAPSLSQVGLSAARVIYVSRGHIFRRKVGEAFFLDSPAATSGLARRRSGRFTELGFH